MRQATAASLSVVALTFLAVLSVPGWTGSRLLPVADSSAIEFNVAGKSFEDDCRVCHDSGVPDRHHLLFGRPIVQGSVVPYPDTNADGAPDGAYVCLSCHGPNFTVERNCVACHSTPVGTVPDGTAPDDEPLTVTVTEAGVLSLDWDLSCGVTDTDYIVYEGVLGDFASHVPVFCSTDEATSATFASPAGSAYYLAVPRNHWSEGSYGLSSGGTQRPTSDSACLSQTIGCPWFE